MSGPTFAAEVARGDPTAITIASRDSELPTIVQREFSDPCISRFIQMKMWLASNSVVR